MPMMYGPVIYDKYPRAHLVVGQYDRDQAVPANGPTRLALLTMLARMLTIAGDYTAIDVLRDAEVRFAFATESDAERFAAAVQAKPTGNEAGWSSKAVFAYDREAYDAIKKAHT